MGVYKRRNVLWIRCSVQGMADPRVGSDDQQAASRAVSRGSQDRRRAWCLQAHRRTFRYFAGEYFEFVKGYKRSWERDRSSLKHLTEAFGSLRLSQITLLARREIQARTQKAGFSGHSEPQACVPETSVQESHRMGEADGNPAKDVKLFREDNAGMRCAEILGLRWQDADLDRRLRTVRMSKSGEKRLIPISRNLTDELLAVKLVAPGEMIFSKADGRPP